MRAMHNLSRSELSGLCEDLGQPRFRANQIWKWLYAQKVDDWAQMRNVPSALRDTLAEQLSLKPAILRETTGQVGRTRKILLEVAGGDCIESVLIPAPARDNENGTRSRERRTVCVSSQVGCKFGCSFCASGQAGFDRNLETGEIICQVLAACRVFGDSPTHVVYMGIGEPFDNYDEVMKSVRIVNDADGLNIGARKITISTCGIVPGINQLAEEGLQVELSVSLHAPFDELRSRLIPANRLYSISTIMNACANFTNKTGRIVTFEYLLARDINDSPQHATELANLLVDTRNRVNLIPLSPVSEFDGTPSPPQVADRFLDILTRAGVNTTLRSSRGAVLKAGCGQLRASHGSKDEEHGI